MISSPSSAPLRRTLSGTRGAESRGRHIFPLTGVLALCLLLGSFPHPSQAQPTQDLSARIDSLIGVLQDTTEGDDLRGEAAVALGRIDSGGEEAVKSLIEVLQDTTESYDLRRHAAFGLSRMGPAAEKAVEPLAEVLQDTTERIDLRMWAVRALGSIGPAAVGPLTEVLKDGSHTLHELVVRELGRMGPAAEEAVDPLIEMLQTPTRNMRLSANAAEALSSIGPAAVGPLTEVLQDTTERIDLRGNAAEVLGSIGSAAETALGPLADVVQDTTETDHLRRAAADGLTLIAEALHNEGRVLSDTLLSTLERAYKSMSKQGIGDTSRLESAVRGLRSRRRLNWRVWVTGVAQRHPYIAGIGALYVLLLGVWIALLGLRPLWHLRINDGLKAVEGNLSLEVATLRLKLPLRHLLLSGFFHYHTRVLDAWVEHYLPKARNRFGKLDTVKGREIHIPLPLERDDRLLKRLAPSDLQDTFARNNACVLIHGEGGAGKTSLACQLARSAMHEDPERRPCESHRLLPVLIESGFTNFFEAIHARLRYLVGAERPPPSDLVEALLRKRRVLVIVDGLSERSSETREAFRPGAKDFPANALMVTSRIEEPLGNVLKTVLRPLRVEGNRVSDLVSAYLRKRGERERFPDSVFFDMLSHFSEMVGDRPIPVLLPRLYAEEMIAAREAGSDDLPANIPDLVLRYLNQVNPADPHDNRTVHRVAKRLAWLCLREDFRPSEASLEAVNEVLSDDELDVVTYLEDRMRILRTVKPAEDRVRFTLDPVAEYLAALYKTDALNGDEEAWWQFLHRVDDLEGEPKATRGFLQAMDDCCRHPDFRDTVPDWVPGQLADHAALEAEPARA